MGWLCFALCLNYFMKIKEQIQQKLNDLESDTILIHSDIIQGFEIPFSNREDFLISHIKEIRALNTNLDIWMPTFNYDFCKDGSYVINESPSKVGVISEYFRKNIAEWRTPIPVFSFAGTGEKPIFDIAQIIDPFGTDSGFQILHEKDALLMHYGSSLSSSTILHYAERISNKIYYRYDKLFLGKIIPNSGKEINVSFNFHVRPSGNYLDYDWIKIEKDLFENNILFLFSEGRTRILLCKIKELISYWLERMAKDPLYFLDNESKLWVKPLLEKLGRPFLITDFEKI